ncbi:hypothetical protein SDC9_48290 [bioreactor metagenome]|uniref:Uncharacterized protein n=1 Tax=bioreactor metagenome TaxID=1076179 RepID=A0A644WDW5_9ZZZZ
MPGTGRIEDGFVVAGARVAVLNHRAERRAVGKTVGKAGEKNGFVGLLPGAGKRGVSRTAARQKGGELDEIDRFLRGQTLHGYADGAPVRLAEYADAEAATQFRRHGMFLPSAQNLQRIRGRTCSPRPRPEW